MKTKLQQGDVLFRKLNKLPAEVERVSGNVLAEGEVTGHFHALVEKDTEQARKDKVPGLQMYKGEDGATYVQLDKELEVTHDEHDRFTVSPGTYQIDIVRSYDYEKDEIEYVRD